MPLSFFQKSKKVPRLENATIANRLVQFVKQQVESKPAWLAKYEKAFGVHGEDAVRAHPGYQKLQETIAQCLQKVLEGRDFHEEARRIAHTHQRLQVSLADFLDACQAIGDEALTLGADTSFISRLRAFVREVVSLYESTLHEANRQLQERESTWQAIARNVTEGIFITTVEEGRILWVNEAFARMMGYTIDDLVGKTWMDLTPPDLLKEELAGKFEKEKQEEIPRYEKSFLHKDGSQIPILISYQAIDGKAFDRATVFLVVAVDISKQKAQEEALLAERNYWLEIFASLSEGAIIFDQDNRIHEINTAVSRMFGYMEEEMRGPSFTLSAKLVAPADQNLVKNKVQEALQTRESVSFEVSHRHKDGHWIPVLLSFKKLTKSRLAQRSHSCDIG